MKNQFLSGSLSLLLIMTTSVGYTQNDSYETQSKAMIRLELKKKSEILAKLKNEISALSAQIDDYEANIETSRKVGKIGAYVFVGGLLLTSIISSLPEKIGSTALWTSKTLEYGPDIQTGVSKLELEPLLGTGGFLTGV